jgi:DNA topoisomerase-2
VSDGVWLTKGLYTFDDARRVVSITELPIGTWTNDYKAFLDELCTNTDSDAAKSEDGKPVLKNFDDLYNHIEVRFDLYLDPDYYEDAKSNTHEFEKRFKLTSTVRTTNMVCFDMNSNIIKYNCVGTMIEHFYTARLAAYAARKARELERLQREATEHDAKARFIRGVLEGSIELRRASDEEIVVAMKTHSLPPLTKPTDPESVDAYEYLLRMRMDRVKAAAVIEQEKAVEAAKAAILRLEGTRVEDLWLQDLEEFQAAWAAMRQAREEALSDVDGKKRTPKRRFIPKKTASSKSQDKN